MPLSRPFPKIFINFYIFLSFWKSHSMDLIRNLSLSGCLRNAFSSHLWYRFWQLFLWFLFLISTFWFSYLMASLRHFSIYKNQFFILEKIFFALVTSYKFFKCSTGQLIECWSPFLNLSCLDFSSLEIFLVWILFLWSFF